VGEKRFAQASHLPPIAGEYLFQGACTPLWAKVTMWHSVVLAMDTYFPHCLLAQTYSKAIKSLCRF